MTNFKLLIGDELREILSDPYDSQETCYMMFERSRFKERCCKEFEKHIENRDLIFALRVGALQRFISQFDQIG